MSIINSIIYIFFFSVITGCASNGTLKTTNDNATNNTVLVNGTLSILLKQSYDQKRIKKLLVPNSKFLSNLVVTEKTNNNLYILDLLKSDKQVIKQLFDKIKSTNFYLDKNIQPIFEVKLYVEKKTITNWNTSSGWGTPNFPYKPSHTLVIKKVKSLIVALNPSPSNCFKIAIPCK